MQLYPETLADPFDIHERQISHSALHSAVVRPVEPATFRRLFLIDALMLPYASNRTAEPNSDIKGHHPQSLPSAPYPYTADESHLC